MKNRFITRLFGCQWGVPRRGASVFGLWRTDKVRSGLSRKGISGVGLLVLGLCGYGFSGCGYYSFTGASIPEHLGTIAIPLVEDNTVSTVTGLDDELTSLLIDRFVRQTKLSLEPNESASDAVLSVTISTYQNTPTSVSGNEQATRNRISITASVRYQDQVQNKELLNRTFSAFEEYDPFTPSQEETAAFAALEKIATDIFTAATSNW